MRTSQDIDQLREQAVAFRRQGKSRRQIKEILGPMNNSTLDDALNDEPPPEWTRRPNAKDDLRAKARELRTQGLSYEEIVAALRVSKSFRFTVGARSARATTAELCGTRKEGGRGSAPLLGRPTQGE